MKTINIPDWGRNLWNRVRALIVGLDARVTALEEGGGGEENVIESISLNGVNVPPVNKNVALSESDPTVPSWAKASTKPTYTANEVGALPNNTTFVSGVKGSSESSYRSGNVNLTAANVGALPATTPIPSKVSDLTNDSGYQTAAQVSSAISAAVSSVYRYKGSVATVADLPSSGNTVGDVYDVQESGTNYAWTGTAWDSLGGLADVSGLWAKDELVAMTTTEIDEIIDEGSRGVLSMLFFDAAAESHETPMGEGTAIYTSNLSYTATAVALEG